MRVGVFLFGSVEMGDTLGHSGTRPTDRRYGPADVLAATRRLLDCGVLADELGYDAFWTTEHHFQHEGYEVVPNAILLGAFLSERTDRIRLGSMFNIVGQWHPLRLAEDFALLHNLSGGRGVLGIGRGTVPREMEPLSYGRVSVGSADNPDQEAADLRNRALTDEGIDLLLMALRDGDFSFQGDYFAAPPAGIADRGETVDALTLVPQPVYPYEIWQAVTSPGSVRAVPARGFGGVFWLQGPARLRANLATFAQTYAATHGRELAPGEKQMLVVNTHIADSRSRAMHEVRDAHDEFWKFLGPYGWSRGYCRPDGSPFPANHVPTLEESMEQGTWVVGSPKQVADRLNELTTITPVEELTIFPTSPGVSYDVTEQQLRRFAAEVRPALHAAKGIATTAGPVPQR